MTDTVEPRTGWWPALPPWARIGMIAFAAIVVALVAVVLVRVLTRVPAIPLGVTAVDGILAGSCVEESATDRDEYTVVSCATAHPQQIFATAELELDASVYALVDDALQAFGDEVCSRYLEYRLFLRADLEVGDYTAYAIDVPTVEEYDGGDTEALCAIAPKDDAPLTRDLYRPMP